MEKQKNGYNTENKSYVTNLLLLISFFFSNLIFLKDKLPREGRLIFKYSEGNPFTKLFVVKIAIHIISFS